jgi:hypothetical protein
MSSLADRTSAQSRLVERAASDSAFRSRLLADPAAAISDELGAPLPDGLEIEVVEETAGKLYLVLPASADSAISDEDLDAISGGKTYGPKNSHHT